MGVHYNMHYNLKKNVLEYVFLKALHEAIPSFTNSFPRFKWEKNFTFSILHWFKKTTTFSLFYAAPLSLFQNGKFSLSNFLNWNQSRIQFQVLSPKELKHDLKLICNFP